MSEAKKKFVSPFALYKSDVDKEAQGVWVPIGPYQFKIARAGGGNDAFKKLTNAKFKPYQVALSNDTMPEAIAQQLLVEVFVETIVLDWKDVGDEAGEEMPFSKEACVKMLTELPDLFTEIQQAATKVSLFRKETLEAAAGN